jgi:hypothetical protein
MKYEPQKCPQEIPVSLETHEEYVSINYKFPDEIEEFQIGLPANIKDLVNEKTNPSINNKTIISIKNIEPDEYNLRMYPLTRFENATYAPYLNTGESYAVHIPCIIPEKIKTKKGEWLEIPRSCISVEINGSKIDPFHFDGFYVNDLKPEIKETSYDNGLKFHFSVDTPNWLQTLIKNKTKENYDLFTKKIGNLSRKIDVVVTYFDTKSAFYDGGVSGNALVIRFGGDAWKQFDSAAHAQITKFVTHEVFHFWNQPDSTLPSWFHEGSAEYAANYVSEVSEFKFKSDNELKKLECMLLHGGSSAHLTPGWSERYKCGQAFWAGIFKDPTDFFNFWREKHNSSSQSDSDFLFNNVPTAIKKNLVDLMNPELNNAQRYESYLTLIGHIQLSKKASQPYMKKIALRHLMASNCERIVSFSEHTDYVNFYHQANCKTPFSQPLPLIYKVNKQALGGDPYELLQSVLISCGRLNKAQLYGEGNSEAISIACPIPAKLFAQIAFE